MMKEKSLVIASDKNWIEGEAIRQLEKSSELSGMIKAVGMPDLHPGKGHPVGASFISQDEFYPHLVGNDIGCGMGLWQTDIKKKKQKLEKWSTKLSGLESEWEGNTEEWLSNFGLENSEHDKSLGTIGGGNHFSELQEIKEVINQELFQKNNLDSDYLFLLTHSGSRGLGESILRKHTEIYGANSLKNNTDEANNYIKSHDYAVNWAKSNRALISKRFLECIGGEGLNILDVCHNSVLPISYQNCNCWLHRKGAAPSDKGLVVIPGSRGTFSYLVNPINNQEKNAYSLAHGAGRKWGRGDTKSRLESRFSVDNLKRNDFGGYIICENKDLLYEEAPQAYKDIDIVVKDLVDFGVIEIVAIFKPLITYKTKRK
jgi:release factor H-coupled RctB family protein